MKKSQPPFSGIFNGPVEIAVRSLCLLGLAAAALVPPLLLTGWFTHQPRLLVFGGLCFAFSATSLAWLKRTGRLDLVSGAFEEAISDLEAGHDTLDSLQRRLDALEEKRGDASFDPWTALELRRKIEQRRRDDPDRSD
jgi:hypothetical protein